LVGKLVGMVSLQDLKVVIKFIVIFLVITNIDFTFVTKNENKSVSLSYQT